jgi:methionine-rich copper-binding protein CopC
MLCHPVNSTVASTQLIVTKSQSSNQMILRLTWTTQIRPGIYNLEFKAVASVNHSTVTPIRRQFDFARVYLKERR